jgi:hypothetical protein
MVMVIVMSIIVAFVLAIITATGPLLVISLVFRITQHFGTNEARSQDGHGAKIHLLGYFASLVAGEHVRWSTFRRDDQRTPAAPTMCVPKPLSPPPACGSSTTGAY